MVKFATKAKRDEIEQIQNKIYLENKRLKFLLGTPQESNSVSKIYFRVDDMETRVTREYEQFDEFIRLTNQTAVEAVLSAEAETKV